MKATVFIQANDQLKVNNFDYYHLGSKCSLLKGENSWGEG